MRKEVILDYVNKDQEIQIKLRGDVIVGQGIGGIGPGKVTTTKHEGIYSITQAVTMMSDTGPKPVQMSFMFDAEDVIWLTEGPKQLDQPRIVVPRPSGIKLGSA